MAEIYRCKESHAFVGKDGVPRTITAGELVSSDDPDIRGRESLYEPVSENVANVTAARRSGRVEDATAEPGEKRSLSTTPGSKPAPGAKPNPEKR